MSLEAADNTTDRTGKSSVAVIIPCYNEALTIAKVVDDFKRVLPDASIYVYDNNSTDGTGDLARAAGAVVRRERRQGKGNVIRTMFRDIEAQCYVIVDGDDTYPAESAREMADAVLLEGVVDCFFDEDGELVVVDFKTDRIGRTQIEERAEHYRPQLEAYSMALMRVMGKKVREKVLYFFSVGEEKVL